LRNKLSRKTFQAWLKCSRRSRETRNSGIQSFRVFPKSFQSLFVQYYKNPTDRERDSFKRFSWIRDHDGVPVRRETNSFHSSINKTKQIFGLTQGVTLSTIPSELVNPILLLHEERDGLLMVSVSHFAFILDRDYSLLLEQIKRSEGEEDLRSNCK
jgi:hypothetical protein